ncbi:MAG: alanine racemase [Clostridiales bacterium]|nr:alanine racemase [Clostridiales bacterium]
MVTQYPLQTIDLAVLRDNVRLIRESVPAHTMVMAVVKADAYGHGLTRVARNALHAGASWLAVARTDEGAILRQAGITAPILVLGAASGQEIGDGVRHGLTLAVTDPLMVKAVQRYAAQEGKQGLVHLKLDTGMGRIGVRTEEEVRAMLSALDDCPNVSLTGVFTHFADADGDGEDYTRLQLARFHALADLLPSGVIRHCANSAAIHRYPEAALDMVRAGISMYGYPPVDTDMPLRPVLTWQTAVTYVKTIHPGDKISYGCTFTADKPMTLATVACGYGDGYHRAATGKAEVLIHGKRCPVVGRICMDQMMVDVTALEDVEPGDEVVLIGRAGDEAITAEELGKWSGTISYEVLLAATARVHRRWINDCDE